tara:strand:+ start:3566 stop:3889 length:324 start_codon:yes stop_codon:yes gene_type:complete
MAKLVASVKIYSFADIDFRMHDKLPGIQGTLVMSNGIRISCVFHDYSYGHEEGFWEIWAYNIEPDPFPSTIHHINDWFADLSKLTSEQVSSMEEALTESEKIFEEED